MMAKYSNYWNVKTSGVEHKALWARTSTEPPCSMHGMNNTLTISPTRPKHRWWDNNKWLLKLHNVKWVTQRTSSYVRKVNGKPTEATRRVCWKEKLVVRHKDMSMLREGNCSNSREPIHRRR
jgi:hypothetical protein